MTKDEALQMCLEYIETDAHERKYVRHAIKEALAQPEQERPQNCGTSYCSCIECVMEPEQEPAEWLTGCPTCGMDAGCDCDTGTWNPPKREWVGLTEEQFLNAAKLAEAGNYMVAFQRIQEWLKQENT